MKNNKLKSLSILTIIWLVTMFNLFVHANDQQPNYSKLSRGSLVDDFDVNYEEGSFFIYECDGRNPLACRLAGKFKWNVGDPIVMDDAKGLAMIEESCSEGDELSCHNLAYLLSHGIAIDKDKVRASEIYRDVCEQNTFNHSCVNLGVLYFHGDGIDQSFSEAENLFSIACDSDIHSGCEYLGFMMLDGYGIDQNIPEAVKILVKACDLNYWANAFCKRL